MIQNVSLVLESDLPTGPKFVLLCLADSSNEYGVCFPSVATISRMTSMTERTVQRRLSWLMKKGYVEIFWDFSRRSPDKKIRHFRISLLGIPKAPQPDYSNCHTQLRQEVIQRFGYICSYCGGQGDEKNGPDSASWQIDRIIPGSRGGNYHPLNVTLSCRKCNISKGAKLTPQDVLSLGAIYDKEGVPFATIEGAQLAPDPIRGTVNKEPSTNDDVFVAPNPSERPCKDCGEVGKHHCPGRQQKQKKKWRNKGDYRPQPAVPTQANRKETSDERFERLSRLL